MTNPVDRWSEDANEGLCLDGRLAAAAATEIAAIRELIAGYPQQDPDLPEGVHLHDGKLIASGEVCRTLGDEWEVLNSFGRWASTTNVHWTTTAYFQVRRNETTELVPWHEAWGRTLPDGEVVNRQVRQDDGYWVNNRRLYVNQDSGMVEVCRS